MKTIIIPRRPFGLVETFTIRKKQPQIIERMFFLLSYLVWGFKFLVPIFFYSFPGLYNQGAFLLFLIIFLLLGYLFYLICGPRNIFRSWLSVYLEIFVFLCILSSGTLMVVYYKSSTNLFFAIFFSLSYSILYFLLTIFARGQKMIELFGIQEVYDLFYNNYEEKSEEYTTFSDGCFLLFCSKEMTMEEIFHLAERPKKINWDNPDLVPALLMSMDGPRLRQLKEEAKIFDWPWPWGSPFSILYWPRLDVFRFHSDPNAPWLLFLKKTSVEIASGVTSFGMFIVSVSLAIDSSLSDSSSSFICGAVFGLLALFFAPVCFIHLGLKYAFCALILVAFPIILLASGVHFGFLLVCYLLLEAHLYLQCKVSLSFYFKFYFQKSFLSFEEKKVCF